MGRGRRVPNQTHDGTAGGFVGQRGEGVAERLAIRDCADVRRERRRRQAEPGRNEEAETGEAVQRRGLATDGVEGALDLAQPLDRVGGRGDGHVHARIWRSRGSDRKSRASVATGRTHEEAAGPNWTGGW